jgi:hypothetical protein
MATLQRFEDIEAWRKARELTKAMYACSGNGDFSIKRALRGSNSNNLQKKEYPKLTTINHKP